MTKPNQAKTNVWSLTGAAMLATSIVALWVWPKFMGLEIHPIFGWAELQSGLTWLEPGARLAVGAIALIIAVLVLFPRTRLAGAWAALTLSVLFGLAHLTPWLGINIPDYGPLMEAMAKGWTAEQIQALGLKGDRGAHFTMALINLGLAALTIGGEMTRRQPRPTRTVRAMELSVT
jgi:hypothetical protein